MNDPCPKCGRERGPVVGDFDMSYFCDCQRSSATQIYNPFVTPLPSGIVYINPAIYPNPLQDEVNKLRATLAQANENLIEMVSQYCNDGVSNPVTYSHSFMSAGESAFEYLVSHGLAKWCENGVDIYDLKWPSAEDGSQ
jgi:hypothetical protein